MLNILIVMLYAAVAAIAGGAIGMWFGLPISQGMTLSVLFAVIGAQIHLGLLRGIVGRETG